MALCRLGVVPKLTQFETGGAPRAETNWKVVNGGLHAYQKRGMGIYC